jgi:ribosome maturation factor RimP
VGKAHAFRFVRTDVRLARGLDDAGGHDMGTVERVRDVVAPILDDLGLDLYDLEHAGGVVRILVDRTDGVGLDVITTATRLVSRALDDADVIGSSYTLEVSSPGLERPLRTAEHFHRAIGSDVSLKTVPTYEGDRRIRGRLVSAEDGRVVVLGDEGDEHAVPMAEIDKARTVFTWGPAENAKAHEGRPKRTKSQKART